MTGVLVCDDDREMRKLLRAAVDADPALQVIGEAPDGGTALTLARSLRPDVVLLDIGMPGPAPGAVVAGLRRTAPEAAIVVLSGYGPERLRSHAAVVNAHLPKTTDLGVVCRVLREAADRGPPGVEPAEGAPAP